MCALQTTPQSRTKCSTAATLPLVTSRRSPGRGFPYTGEPFLCPFYIPFNKGDEMVYLIDMQSAILCIGALKVEHLMPSFFTMPL